MNNKFTYSNYLNSRQAGHRVGENLQNIIPLIVYFCQCKDEELVEYSLQAFEAFIRRCPKEITNYIKEIMGLCLKYISYDPNYNYDDEDENGYSCIDEDGNEDDEEYKDNKHAKIKKLYFNFFNFSDQEDYSDDDDVSWKIRRAASKCLEAIISTRHELLSFFYTEVSPILIGRFKGK